MAEIYQRPKEAFRFLRGGGLNTLQQYDGMPPDEYPMAVNVRWDENNAVQTRPGYVSLFTIAGANPITDIESYSAMATDNLPRFLVRAVDNKIYLDTGTQVGTLGGSGPAHASMVAYRPNQSPNPYMYVATNQDYQKFSAPDASNAVTQQKVGIAEPQASPEACPNSLGFYQFSAVAASWTAGGTGGAIADATRISDTATAIFADPAGTTRYSVQVGSKQYQIGETLAITKSSGGVFNVIVQDVLPPVNNGAAITVQSIYYYSGTTGRCVVVLTQSPVNPVAPVFQDGAPQAASIFAPEQLSALRRGSLVSFSGGPEVCLVLNVTTGPGGTMCFEVSTTGTHAAGETVTGKPAIVVSDITNLVVGQAIAAVDISTSQTTGTGTFTLPLATNPFNQALAPGTTTPQQDDYVHFSVNIDDLTKLVNAIITFDVKDGAADYVTDTYYYVITASSILGFTPSNYSPSPTSQWTEVMFPISALIRVGSDATRSLANVQGVRVSFLTLGNINILMGSFWVGGGGQPDVGQAGSPYFYCYRFRSSVTGTRSNRSPITRYGVSPRREPVNVVLPGSATDPQVDTIDIFRYGGTVTSMRYIGSAVVSATSFTDNYSDEAANGGSLLETDNYEPWPTIEIPYTATPGTASGVTTTVVVTGTTVVVIYSKATAFTTPFYETTARWLPGTLAIIGGQSAYILWDRPTSITITSPPAHYYAYLFQFVENLGASGSFGSLGSGPVLSIVEPNIANQPLPYVWGPNDKGDLFGAGDIFRPGNFYYIKSNNPDSAPDKYNQELTDPSEPLLGGEILDGVSLIFSPKRWWALYPNFGNVAQRYTPVERPVGRGCVAPFGHCTDSKTVWFVARDGIWQTTGGGGSSLTDATIYNLFPHEGVTSVANVTLNGFTAYAPDYSRAGAFILAYCNSYLYFDYQDSTGTARTLVCDLRDPRRPAWSVDSYNDSIVIHHAIDQQSGTVLSQGTLYKELLMADTAGKVYRQADNANDNNVGIACALETFEFNGGDLRSFEQWGDAWIDLYPVAIEGAAGVSVTPVSDGAAVAAATVITANPARTQSTISLGTGVLKQSLGLFIRWGDDFSVQTTPTRLLSWQPSSLEKPEETTDRATDWDDAGTMDNKFWQGFILEADTFGVDKTITVRDNDLMLAHSFTPTPVNHNGQQEKAYSFDAPFLAHMVRLEPDSTPWRGPGGSGGFKIKWVTEPTPESVRTWKTQGTAHGQTGYQHLKQMTVAYASTADVVITVTVQGNDGIAPAVVTLPSTGGAYRKTTFTFTANKSMLYFYSAVSAQPWQPFLNDWEILVGGWGRATPYLDWQSIGGNRGDQARI